MCEKAAVLAAEYPTAFDAYTDDPTDEALENRVEELEEKSAATDDYHTLNEKGYQHTEYLKAMDWGALWHPMAGQHRVPRQDRPQHREACAARAAWHTLHRRGRGNTRPSGTYTVQWVGRHWRTRRQITRLARSGRRV